MGEAKENTIVINLIGIGCKVFVIRPAELLLEKLFLTARKINSPLEEAIFDGDFFRKLGDDNIKGLNDLSEFSVQGLLNEPKSQIEIRMGGRKKRTIYVSELMQQQTLLPLYNVEFISDLEILLRDLIATEKETGLTSSFKMSDKKIDLDKMKFKMAEINTGFEKLTMLCEIHYDNQLLKSVSDDTVVTSNYAIFK